MPQIYIDKIKHDTDVFRLRDTTLFSNNNTNLKIHQSFLPSYVDDVLEYNSINNFPSTGETGKIYVDTTSNKVYRWSGSTYIAISSNGDGTVTSVRVQGTSPIVSSQNTAQTTTLNTTISLAAAGPNTVLAGPSTGTTSAAPTYRKLTAADTPDVLPLTGGTVTGPVTFGDSVSIDDLSVGTLSATGNATFTNNISANTINGVTVGSTPKFTDTITTVTTTGTGNAIVGITASNGVITATKGTVSDTDTKNTAGSTNSTSKLFLIGATSQAANPQTYSRSTVYIGTDGKVYSASKAVLVGGSNAASSVTVNTSSSNIYSMSSAGSVTAGTAPSFTQGTDSFTAAKLNTGFYTAGTATTPAVINTSKFSGGSFTRGSFSGGSFTQGTDSFTTNVPTKIDTSKFSGGSFTRGTFSQGTLPSLIVAVDSTDSKQLNITFSQGTLPTHAADSFTAASLASGFYTAGAAASFTQGTDTFTAATHGNDTFTAASLASGFYTAGTKGTPTTIDTSKFSGGSFTQGTDTFSAGTIPSVVTLPTRSSAISVLTGITSATAAAQTFTGITE